MKRTPSHLKKLAVLLSLLSTPIAFSGTMGPIYVPTTSFVTTLSVGPGWADEAQNQTVYLAPVIIKTYTANDSSDVFVNGELFLGLQKQVRENVTGQLGIALAASSAAKRQGYIWDDASPLFNNYSYHYNVSHAHVALKGKLLANNSNFFVSPFIGGSVGVGFNGAHDYDNTPLIFEAVKNPNFGDNTTTTFTYTAEAGLQKNFTPNCAFGVSYQFADWGKNELGRAAGQVSGSGLKHDHLYTNSLMFSISYIS